MKRGGLTTLFAHKLHTKMGKATHISAREANKINSYIYLGTVINSEGEWEQKWVSDLADMVKS